MFGVGPKVLVRTVVAAMAVCGGRAVAAKGEAGAPASQPGRMDRRETIVEIRGERTPVAELLRCIAEQASLVLLIDPAADPGALAKEIDLELTNSQARQALGWVTDLAGLRIYLTDGALLVAGEDEKSMLLAAAGGLRSAWPTPGGWPVGRQEEMLERVGIVDLVDASLSAAVRVLRKVFRVDVLAAPQVLENQALVSVAGTSVTLEAALQEVCRQAGAAWSWRWGAIWICPNGAAQSEGGDGASARKGASGQRRGLGNRKASCYLVARDVVQERVLTHLGKLFVNRYRTDYQDRRKVVTIEAKGTPEELIDLIESVPDQEKKSP
jgi:hypothetical protein